MELKRSEKAYRDSTAVKIKTWADALRNTISKMPNESIDAVSWFVTVNKLFEQYCYQFRLICKQFLFVRIYPTGRNF